LAPNTTQGAFAKPPRRGEQIPATSPHNARRSAGLALVFGRADKRRSARPAYLGAGHHRCYSDPCGWTRPGPPPRFRVQKTVSSSLTRRRAAREDAARTPPCSGSSSGLSERSACPGSGGRRLQLARRARRSRAVASGTRRGLEPYARRPAPRRVVRAHDRRLDQPLPLRQVICEGVEQRRHTRHQSAEPAL